MSETLKPIDKSCEFYYHRRCTFVLNGDCHKSNEGYNYILDYKIVIFFPFI
jgi:hypothetical protein